MTETLLRAMDAPTTVYLKVLRPRKTYMRSVEMELRVAQMQTVVQRKRVTVLVSVLSSGKIVIQAITRQKETVVPRPVCGRGQAPVRRVPQQIAVEIVM